MISALFYLQFQSVKNRLVLRVKRLKQPKYLIGAIVGGLYFYWYFFRVLFGRRGNWGAGKAVAPHGLPNDPQMIESLGALVLFLMVFIAWFFPRKRASLAFTEAEVAFLFPAPVSRRGLIHFKLLRSQLGILFTVLVFTLLSGRFGFDGHWLTRAAGWWVILFTLNLHFLGSSFALTMLMDRGISTWKRRVAVIGLVLAALAGVGTWAVGEFPALTTSDLANAHTIMDYAKQTLVSGPLPYLLYPFRFVVRPYLAADWLGFLAALVPALLLMALHYAWVIRSDVAFEEASVEASQRIAERIAAARAGKLGAGRQGLKSKRPPFHLAPTGPPFVALLWKNLLSAGKAMNTRTWFILLIVATTMGVSLFSTSRTSTLPVVVGTLCGMFGAWAVLLGPQIMRQDFRQDLPQAGLLKLFPLPGWQIALGEILAPAIVLTAVQWLLVLVGICCVMPFTRAAFPGGLVLAIGAGAAVILPMLNLISLLIPNAAVLLFPSWFQTGREGPHGIEATGQRLIFALGQFLAFVIALLPATAAFAGFFFLVKYLAGIVIAVLIASAAAALVLALEAGLGVLWLGWLFGRLDLSAEHAA